MEQISFIRLDKFMVIGLLSLTTAHGEFALIEDFNELTEGELGTQNGWVADPAYSVVVDPDGGTNLVLQCLTAVQSGAYKGLLEDALPEGEEGTLFYRFRFDSVGNGNTGFTDVAAPFQYNDFESQVNRQANTPIKGRDGALFQDLSPSDSLVFADDPDVWYQVWLVANNGTDTSRVYLQSNDDPDFIEQTEVFTPDGAMEFRNGTAEALATLMLRAQQGSILWDDFYVSAGVDLTNPAPGQGPGGGKTEITDFEIIPGVSAELTWSSISGHQYAVETSANLADWTPLINLVLANSTSTSTELFDGDIAPVDGHLFFRVRDLGIPRDE